MPVTAKLSHLRIAPRKVRLVADLIRGKKVGEAETILNFAVKKSARPILKLLKSAVSNAKNNFQTSDDSNLYISKIIVDEGPKLKRWRARARGSVASIQKKTSHIKIVLEEIGGKSKKIKKIRSQKKKKMPEISAKKEEIKQTRKEKKERFRPEIIAEKPKTVRGIQRIFKRKAF